MLSASDLARYKVDWREPLRGTYRDRYEIIAMPPPSSGGIAILETLNILEGYDLAAMGRTGASRHLIIEALKHAFADRARWLGDADFVRVPVERLTSKAYAAEKRARIRPGAVGAPADYGSAAPPPDDSGTTHVSVVDAAGDLLACTSTINTSFGSMVYVPEWGIILNNEMDDFSAQPGAPNAFGLVGNEQNAIAPNKRPLSSMSPTIVLDKGAPFMAVGGSGGPTIITGTLLALVRALDFGATPTEAVTWPRLHHQWAPDRAYLEPGADGTAPGAEALRAAGHEIAVRPGFNAVQLVVRAEEGAWIAVSDPRKMGRPAAPPAGAAR